MRERMCLVRRAERQCETRRRYSVRMRFRRPPPRPPASMQGMNIIFVEPAFPANQRQFVRGLAEVGANVIGIGERPVDLLDQELRGWHAHYQQIPSVTDVEAHAAAGPPRAEQGVGRPARVDDRGAHHGRRARAGGVRDPRHVGAHGVAVPRQAVDEGGAARGRACRPPHSTAARSAAEVRAFAEQVGYPLILKPRSGAGASGTMPGRRCRRARARAGESSALRASSRSPSRSSSRATRASTTRSRSTGRSRTTSSRTTTRTCSRRCGPAGSRRSSSPPTGSTPRRTTRRLRELGRGSSRRSGSAPRRRTWSGSSARRA